MLLLEWHSNPTSQAESSSKVHFTSIILLNKAHGKGKGPSEDDSMWSICKLRSGLRHHCDLAINFQDDCFPH